MRTGVKFLTRFLFVFLLLTSVGCTNLFLRPDRVNYFPKAGEFIQFTEGHIPTSNGQSLHYWFVPAQVNHKLMKKPKGLVVQVHGNAQNLSSHIRGMGWITEQGYNLFAFDYEGYGQSTGQADLDRAFSDVQTALDFVEKTYGSSLPLYFYGQSLGGTLLLKAVSSEPQRWHPKMVIIESSFYSYQQIAREKLSQWWLSWPFQWLAYLLITDRYGLEQKELASLAPLPVYLFYSEHDPIVPVHNGQRIFKELNEPKNLTTFPEPGHIHAMWVQKGKLREGLLEAMHKYAQ